MKLLKLLLLLAIILPSIAVCQSADKNNSDTDYYYSDTIVDEKTNAIDSQTNSSWLKSRLKKNKSQVTVNDILNEVFSSDTFFVEEVFDKLMSVYRLGNLLALLRI